MGKRARLTKRSKKNSPIASKPRSPADLLFKAKFGKWELRRHMAFRRRHTTYSSQRTCGIAPIPNQDFVCAMEDGSAIGIQRCEGSSCPRCAWKVRGSAIKELDQGLYEIHMQGGSIVLATLTSSSKRFTPKIRWNLMQKAFQKLKKRAILQRFFKKHRLFSSPRGTEAMINAWLSGPATFHIHHHIAFAFEGNLSPEDIEIFQGLIKTEWKVICEGLGLFATADQQHVTLANGANAAERKYLAKGIAQEVAEGRFKVGKNGSVSIHGLWHCAFMAAEGGDEEECERLLEIVEYYESELKGKQTLSIDKKLRELGQGGEEEGEESEEEREEVKMLLAIPVTVWVALRALGVAWLTPQACAQNGHFLGLLSAICEEVEIKRLSEDRGLRGALEAQYIIRIKEIYGRLIPMTLHEKLVLFKRSPAYLICLGRTVRDWSNLKENGGPPGLLDNGIEAL